MRSRTRLTTPPGQRPASAGEPSEELYVPGLSTPEEPLLHSRWRPFVIALDVLLIVAVLATGLFVLANSAQEDDPSLQVDPTPATTPEG